MAVLIDKPQPVSRDHYLMTIAIDAIDARPGQFANIKIGTGSDPLLRRPFSIFNREGNTVEIVFRVVGRGTAMLKEYEKGRVLDILAPLGTGFTLVDRKSVLLVGGGVGNAPLYYLARELRARGNHITCLYGASQKEYIYCEDNYQRLADSCIITTDDGSAGIKGFVTDALGGLISGAAFDTVYICGPTKMMHTTVEMLKATKARLEVSMENYFGCGIGICSGCTIQTADGLKRACVDGPVMDGRSIRWETLA